MLCLIENRFVIIYEITASDMPYPASPRHSPKKSTKKAERYGVGSTLWYRGMPYILIMVSSGLTGLYPIKSPIGIARRIAQGHAYDKHVLEKGEFPEIANPGEFEHLIDDVMNNYDDSKSLTRGRAAYWKDDIVVITNPVDPDGGTAFRPVDGKEYYDNLK